MFHQLVPLSLVMWFTQAVSLPFTWAGAGEGGGDCNPQWTHPCSLCILGPDISTYVWLCILDLVVTISSGGASTPGGVPAG